MKKKITLKKIKGGRLGDRLKTISSMLIWSKILDCQLVWNPCMNQLGRGSKKLFGKDALKANNIWLGSKARKHFRGMEIMKWDGFTLAEILKIKQEFDKGNFDLFIFKGVPRIHFHHLLDFASTRSEFKDIYYESVDWFRKLYWYNRKKTGGINISIHIRRGDIAKKQINYGATFDYYKNLIIAINNYAKSIKKEISVTIFCEKWNNKDIRPLYKLENVEPMRNFSANKDFHDLCSSDILIPSKSGFSSIASYLCAGSIIYDPHIGNPNKNHFFTSELTSPDNVYLFSNITEFKSRLAACLTNDNYADFTQT